MYTYENSSLQTGHICTCETCGKAYTEAHIWETIVDGYVCSKCGLTSSFIPVTPESLSVEILATIDLTENNSVRIDENTVLCYVNGQYYLVRGQNGNDALQIVKNNLAVK